MNRNELPSFFILGVQKAATSSVHTILNQDKDFSLPYKKETHYFSKKYNNELEWYLKQFRNVDYKIKGEIDPSYIFYKNSAKNIKSCIRNPKFIIIFRKPIDRAYSHYLMSKSRGYEKKSFNISLRLESDRLMNGGHFSISHHSYLLRGLYSDQVMRFRENFPKSNFLFLKYEDFIIINNRKKFFKKIYNFLNIEFKNNLNISIHENSAGRMKFKLLRDLTYSENYLRSFLRKIVPSEYLRFMIVNKINKFNRKKIIKTKLNYDVLDQKYIEWNNKQSKLVADLCDIDTNDWII